VPSGTLRNSHLVYQHLLVGDRCYPLWHYSFSFYPGLSSKPPYSPATRLAVHTRSVPPARPRRSRRWTARLDACRGHLAPDPIVVELKIQVSKGYLPCAGRILSRGVLHCRGDVSLWHIQTMGSMCGRRLCHGVPCGVSRGNIDDVGCNRGHPELHRFMASTSRPFKTDRQTRKRTGTLVKEMSRVAPLEPGTQKAPPIERSPSVMRSPCNWLLKQQCSSVVLARDLVA
jgi:hypothetical protein